MELPNGNECATKPRTCCRKLANPSMVGTKPFWKDGTMTAIFRKSLSEIGWTWRTDYIQYEELALKDNSYIATRGDRDRNEKKLGSQVEWRRCSRTNESTTGFRWSETRNETDCMMNMWRRLQKETHPFILYNDQDSEGVTNLKNLKSITIKSMPKQVREPILRSHGETCRGIQHIRPRQLSGSSTTIGSPTKAGILGDPHPVLSSSDFLVQRCLLFLSLAGKWITWQSTVSVWTDTPAARQIFTCTVTPQITQHRDEYNVLQELEGSRRFLCAEKNILSSTRHVCTLCCTRHSALPHLLFLLPLLCCCRLLLRTQTCCPRIQLSTAKIHCRMTLLRNTPPPQVMSPKGSSSTGFWSNHKIKELTTRMALKNLVSKSCPTVYQFTIRQKALRRRPTRTSKTSNHVSCWLHHCKYGNERKMKDKHELITLNEKAWWSSLLGILKYQGNLMRSVYTSEETNAQRTQAYHSRRESLMTSSSGDLEVSGKLDAMFSCHSASSQNTFSERDRSNESGNRFESSAHSFFKFADLANVGKSLLDWKPGPFA